MKYYSHTLGCKVNAYETAAIDRELDEHGFSRAETLESADIVLLNTCSVTGKADAKSRQHISSFRKRNPNAVLVVMGCYGQADSAKCASIGADIVLGTSSRSKVIPYLERFLLERKTIVDVKPSVRKERYEELGANAFCENARAYLKVQDGCDNFCSYCYIPMLRGNSRSREPREVVEEAVSLVEKGYQEIVLTGVDTGSYGKDLGDGSFTFTDLMEAILKNCPSLFRLRISSIEESQIDDRFLSFLESHPQVADHLHIPLQSGSPGVLKRMKRHYNCGAFLEKLARIRSVRPEIAITTDVIVGYPEETDEEFTETLEFCKKASFAEIHVFPFSPRPGTYAATRPDLPSAIKKERVHALLALSKSLRSEYKQRFFGREMEVLFEEYDAQKKRCSGHTSNYLLVNVESEEDLHGQRRIVQYDSKIASD